MYHRLIRVPQSHRVLNSRIQDYKRIMMLIASNDIPRLNQIISITLRHGSSATAIAAQIQRAIDGLYSPRGGFTQRDLDVAFLCQAIGGRRLLYSLSQSHGLPSETTVRRTQTVPRLLPSVGVPTAKEINFNISAFLDPCIKPAPLSFNGRLPGMILGFDGISIEKKCRYCPKRGVVLGLCREHSVNVNTHVRDPTVVQSMWDALQSADTTKKVCWGSEATVAVVAPYGRTANYSPTPLVLSPTDKTEKAEGLKEWIQTTVSAWNAHENGAGKHGPIWSIASDGDATFRRVRHDLCNQLHLDPQTPLGRKLSPLLGFNCFTSWEIITATCDPKHIFKRFATLVRSTGIILQNQSITRDDIREQLLYLKVSLNETNDLLNTEDKQNVPKAVRLLRHLGDLPRTPPPVNEFSRLRYDHISFIARFFGFFLEPFVDVHMNLSQQLESLSTFSHLAVALQLEPSTSCITSALYADTQAIIKNIYFVVAQLQLISPDLTLHIIHEGTDRLERLFGDCRTLDHGRNFDILQLSEKMAIATLINSAYERNPDLDRGHRRLNLSSTKVVDHVNPSSWLGDTRVGSVDLATVWDAGRNLAVNLLEVVFGVHKTRNHFNFEQIFLQSNRDMLWPNGIYVGVQSANKIRLDQLHPDQSVGHTQIKDHECTDNNSSDNYDMENGLPDNPSEELNPLQTFSVAGASIKIDSLISSIHPSSWRQRSDRIFRVQGLTLDKFNACEMDGLLDPKEAVNNELLKAYDIVGILIRVDNHVCLAVMEVVGISLPNNNGSGKRIFSMSAKYSDLTTTKSDIQVLGQIIKIVPSIKQAGYWEWAREYILPIGNSKNRERKQGRKQSFTITVPSYLILPLAVNMISYPHEPRESRLRWALSAEELQRQMLYAWNLLSPEFNADVSKFESIPIIKNSGSLPYKNKSGTCYQV